MIQEAKRWLGEARAVTVLTGAGFSAESGVPTFRGAGGLWRNFRAEDLATPEAFARDPKTVWEWYDWRRGLIAECKPNLGHFALVDLEKRVETFHLVTQNVDGLHDRAGSRRVLKIHGDIWWVQCTRCREVTSDRRVPLPELPPLCACGGMLRPGVVWFGESLPLETWNMAQEAAEKCDVLLVAGTSAVVYPAAGLVPLAKGRGAKVIEVNLEETHVSRTVDCSLRGLSGEILPQLVD